MKNDKLLTELRKIEADLLTERGEVSAYIALQNLILEVECEIRDECNVESGKGAVAKAAQRILKSASYSPREAFHKAFRSRRGLLLCDGFRALRFNPDTAPLLLEHPLSYDYPDIDRLIDGSKGNDVPVELPDIGELRTFIKTEKARLKAKKQKGGVRLPLECAGCPSVDVDAQFLLDMLEALPGATVTASRVRTQTSALYFKAENGDGILLPLRPINKD